MPTIKVQGMHCKNCQNAVTKALEDMPGLLNVSVDLTAGSASWEDKDPAAPVDQEKIKAAIRNIGFDA